MSDSQSDGLMVPLEAVGGAGSKESISTENDTERDIEEMESIASYEVPIEEKVERPPEPIESKVSTVPNSTKKEPVVESKKDAPASKKDIPASKKDTASPKKEAPPPKKDVPPSKKDVPPSKKDVPSSKKDTIASKKDSANFKDDTSNQQKESIPEKVSVPPKESQSSKPPKPEISEVPTPSLNIPTQHSAVNQDTTEITKDVDQLLCEDIEKSKSDKASDRHTHSSKRGSKSSPDKTLTKSSKQNSNKDVHAEKKTKGTGSFTSKASSSGAKTIRSATDHTAASSVQKTESYVPQTKSYESAQSKTATSTTASSKTGESDANHSTTKHTNYAERMTHQTRSISVTSHARAETTPSHHPSSDSSTETEQFSIADTSDVVSVSVSSGLQSIRDIFFDEDDSHKGYLKQQEKDFLDASYWSHHHGETSEQFSRISNPSFNSHVEAPTTMLPEVDEGTYLKLGGEVEKRTSDIQIEPVEPPVESIKLSPINKCVESDLSDVEDNVQQNADQDELTPLAKDKRVDFAAGSDVISLTFDEHTDEENVISDHQACKDHLEKLSIASEDIAKTIDKKFISFTPNTLLCDISNIIPNHQNLVRVEGRHILNKEVCLEFMCWLENLNDLFMSSQFSKAMTIFRRQESRFKIVLYECLKIAQGCGLDICFERVAAMAHISFDIIYTMLPYCDGIKWYSQLVSGARNAEHKLAEAYMLLCMGQLMVYGGDCFEAQRHLRAALLIVKQDYASEQDLYQNIKHVFGMSVALCDCNDIDERESGLIKMTEALVMTRSLYGSSSIETALARLHIGIAYRSLYDDTALRLEGLDYVERAHEVLEDRLGHHPYMGICVQTLALYHDDMIDISFNSEYNQALKCYKLGVEIQRTALGDHSFTSRALTQMGDFYHRMADYKKAGSSLNEAHEMSITYCPTDLVSALAAFHLGLLYMDDSYPEHDIFRGHNLLTSSANLLSKYGVTYQRALMLQHMAIASEEAGLKHTFYKQESENIKSAMFGAASATQAVR